MIGVFERPSTVRFANCTEESVLRRALDGGLTKMSGVVERPSERTG